MRIVSLASPLDFQLSEEDEGVSFGSRNAVIDQLATAHAAEDAGASLDAGVALQEIVRQHFNIFNWLRLHETREFA